MMDGSMMMGWFWIWPVLVLLGVLLLGYAVYRLVQGHGGASPTEPSSALQILDERYARGEIDDEEYQQRRAKLQ
jgi:putative membrane protein